MTCATEKCQKPEDVTFFTCRAFCQQRKSEADNFELFFQSALFVQLVFSRRTSWAFLCFMGKTLTTGGTGCISFCERINVCEAIVK